MNSPFVNQISRVKPLIDYVKKQQENQKVAKTAELAATFLLISLFMFFAIRPTVLTISSLIGDIKSKQLLKSELKTKINNVIKAQDVFSQIESRYQILDTSLPDRPRYYDTYYQIKKVSEANSHNIDRINFDLRGAQDNLPDPNAKSFSVNLGLSTPFNQSLGIIDSLLQNRRLLDIDSFTINQLESTASTDSATSSLKTGFSAIFYYWPNNEKK